MNKLNYNKTPLSYKDQLVLLEKRGLIINDKDNMLNWLNEPIWK